MKSKGYDTNFTVLLLISLYALFPVTASAEQCPVASGDERRACLRARIDQNQQNMTALVKEIERTMRGIPHFEQWKQDFRLEQAAWHNYQNKHCQILSYLWGGSGVTDAILACRLRLIEARAKELSQLYDLTFPKESP